jgi:preprotein translocase subunit SecE
MGRASRRAQERADRRQRGQQTPARMTAAPSGPSGGDGPPRRGSLLRPLWARDIIGELRKVTWPSRSEVYHLTLVVIVVSIFFGIILGGADLAFSWFVERTILR